jgi:hypothetical protein
LKLRHRLPLRNQRRDNGHYRKIVGDGGKGRNRRSAFDPMLKDAMRPRIDIPLIWSTSRAKCPPWGAGHGRTRTVSALDRVRAEGKRALGHPKGGSKVEEAIRDHLAAGHGILKIAKTVGVGSGTSKRLKREMATLTGWEMSNFSAGFLAARFSHDLRTKRQTVYWNSVKGFCNRSPIIKPTTSH